MRGERKINFDSYSDLSKLNLDEIFDHKGKQKINALFYNFALTFL